MMTMMIREENRMEEERCWFCQERFMVMPGMEKQRTRNMEAHRSGS